MSNLWNTSTLNVRNEASIMSLYREDQPQCKDDGWRLPDQASLEKHLDRIFQENKRTREAAVKGGLSRQWYVSKEEWVSTSSNMDADDDGAAASAAFFDQDLPADANESEAEAPSIRADEKQEACPLCGESFARFF